MRMSGLKLRKSVFFYTLAIGTFLVLLPSWARAQENTSGSSLNKSRQFAAIAHNPAAHQFVLFGGINSGLDGGGVGLISTILGSGAEQDGKNKVQLCVRSLALKRPWPMTVRGGKSCYSEALISIAPEP